MAMATVARSGFSVLLFIGLFTVSVKYVHTWPQPMAARQLDLLLRMSGKLGIHDPDDLYIPAMMVAEVAVTVVVYALTMNLWRRYGARRRNNTTHE